jgi:hypothetical protein
VTTTLYHRRDAAHRTAALIAERALLLGGVLLLATAVLANQRWLDRHFLPSFFLARHSYVLLETAARMGMGVLGIGLALVVRRPVARFVGRSPWRAVHVTLAVILALAASELALRSVHLRPAEWLGRDQEPRRQADALLGWAFVPSRTARSRIGGRVVDYTFDAAGCRVRGPEEPVDPSRPTIVFTGESLMFGKGLTWEESVPAQVGTILGRQTANLAVDGYATDQAYMRLSTELPRFREPIAVVATFMTTLFGRNLDSDRPHLGPGLVWLAPVHHTRLRSLVQLVAPYHGTGTVERGIAVTREVLRATVTAAASRGATPLIVVPQFGREDGVEQMLRTRILDEAGLPYVLVEIDPAWRLPGDVHPNAYGARVIAAAIAKRLRVASRESRVPGSTPESHVANR